ncbi:uncharacterized protein [Argopecten irradians]|uniref:uncharacterized protein n=1 Tax=Argopecten irradians TaxID=31199 RepID=UPI0037167F64
MTETSKPKAPKNAKQPKKHDWPIDTLFQHVHLYKGEHLPVSGARNYRRPQVPEVPTTTVVYRTNRILIALLIFFITTTAVAVAILLLRELSRKEPYVPGKVRVTSEALMSAYPGMFRTIEDENDIIDTELDPKDFKPVNRFINIDSTCKVSCDSNSIITQPPEVTSNMTSILRDKRSSRSYAYNALYHGCCVSNFYHISPNQWKTKEGYPRTLIQLTKTRQFFQIENCSQALGCAGCTCMTDRVLTTAVVLKTDTEQTAETTMDDLEIQAFYFDGCCKCVNVAFKN